MKVCHFEKQMCANYILKKYSFSKNIDMYILFVQDYTLYLKDLLEYALSIQYGA